MLHSDSLGKAMHQLACFGFVTCFDADSAVCKACDDIKTCHQACGESLSKMNGAGDFSKAVNKHNRWARRLGNKQIDVTTVRENFEVPDDDARIQGLSKNALKIAKVMLHHEFSVPQVTRDVANQFLSNCPKELAVFADFVMKKQFKTRAIIDELKRRYGWRESTAKSCTSAFVEVLVSWQQAERVKRGEYRVNV